MRRTSTHLLEVWRTDLPGLVLLLQVGNAVNWLGYGLILPFEIIYLHQVRGFALIHSELDATALLATAAIVFAIGECVHNVVLGPLVADLAPPQLLGRYISLYSLMVSGGFALGPAIGGALLATSPDAIWWGGPTPEAA